MTLLSNQATTCVAAVLAVSLAAAGQVRAQPDPAVRTSKTPEQQAKDVARAALALVKKREYGPAIILYKRAHRIYPRSYQLCNIGFAYDELKRPARAHLFLSACIRLARTEGKNHHPKVSQVLAAVEAQLRAGTYGQVRLEVVPPGALTRVSVFDRDETIDGSHDLWLPAGEITLTVDAPGHVSRTLRIIVGAGKRDTVKASLHKAEPKPHAVPPAEAPAPATPPPNRRRQPPVVTKTTQPSQSLRTVTEAQSRPRWALGLVGVGVVSLGIGALLHVKARNTLADIDDLDPVAPGTPNPVYDAKASDYRRYRRYTYGAYAAGAAVTGLGMYLYLRTRSRERTIQGHAAPSAGGGMAWVSARF